MSPGIGDETAPQAGERTERFRLLIADREHQGFGGNGLAIVEIDAPLTIVAARMGRSGLGDTSLSRGDRLVEDFTEIPPEEPPLGKTAALAALAFEAAHEMLRIVGPGAH